MTRSVDVTHGKKFERYFHDEVLSKTENVYPCTHERVIDSAAAGNIIRQADCDFKTCVKGEVRGCPYHFLWELKASIRFTEFIQGFRDLIDDDQLAKMRKAERAGAYGVYLFLNVKEDMVEIFPAKPLFALYHERKSKADLSTYPAFTISKLNLRAWFSMQVLSNPKGFIQQMESYT